MNGARCFVVFFLKCFASSSLWMCLTVCCAVPPPRYLMLGARPRLYNCACTLQLVCKNSNIHCPCAIAVKWHGLSCLVPSSTVITLIINQARWADDTHTSATCSRACGDVCCRSTAWPPHVAALPPLPNPRRLPCPPPLRARGPTNCKWRSLRKVWIVQKTSISNMRSNYYKTESY